uniref:Proton-coupled amino acid transporter 4 n=1 Tax=Cacopsylla melanoneura TaxID=428564 RepID=A0A8D8S6T2_9HEMI
MNHDQNNAVEGQPMLLQPEAMIEIKKSKFHIDQKKERGDPAKIYQSDTITKLRKKPAHFGQSHAFIPSKHQTSYVETMMHFLKGNIGSGLLAMGDAFRHGGILLAPPITVFVGLISLYNQHMLVRNSLKLHSKLKLDEYPGFSDTMELSFLTGPRQFQRFTDTIRRLVKMFVIITQLGFCCVYFVFVSESSHQICLALGYKYKVEYHMAMWLAPILATALIRNLKYIAPISALANLIMGLGIAAIYYYILQDLPEISSRQYVGNVQQIPLFFGTIIFAFEGIALVLPLQREMKKKKNFTSPWGVLNVGSFFIIFFMLSMGFFGYLKFGDAVKGSITLNLSDANSEDRLALVVIGAIGFGILCTYSLQFYVPVAIIWAEIEEAFGPFKHPGYGESILRVALVFITFILAEVIPKLGLFISLVGAVSSTGLALIFPPLSDIAVRKKEGDFAVCNWH